MKKAKDIINGTDKIRKWLEDSNQSAENFESYEDLCSYISKFYDIKIY